jgi:succinate dehydrogenase / fumarate reductase iron-sulfur subunit
MQETYEIVLKIRRYDPDNEKSWIQRYQLETGRILRFTDLFRKINKELDATLAWNSSCEHGQCGTCSVKINGKPMLACELLVENAVAHFETTEFLIEPLTIAPVVRDLIVDFDKAYERVHKIKPYIIDPVENPNSGNEYKISPSHLERYVDATRCINCFCWGPNAIMASVVRLMDLREQAKNERKKLLYSEEGVYRCHTSMACSFVCPKEIDVAHFIALAKSGEFESDTEG